MSRPHFFSRLLIVLLLATRVSWAADPILVGHRGLLRHAPENTLPTFAVCLELGIGFELDIRTTRDGHLVVIHDDSLERTTDGGNRSIRSINLDEARTLDAGSWFNDVFAGVRIPTLEETLALVQSKKRKNTIIALNVKQLTSEGEKQVVELTTKYGLLNDCFAFDQDDAMSRRLKKLNPKFRIGQNVSRGTLEARLNEGLLDVFLVTFVPTSEQVTLLRQNGKQIVFNFGGDGESRRNPETWNRARAAGIDGMLTDFPLECRRAWRNNAEP